MVILKKMRRVSLYTTLAREAPSTWLSRLILFTFFDKEKILNKLRGSPCTQHWLERLPAPTCLDWFCFRFCLRRRVPPGSAIQKAILPDVDFRQIWGRFGRVGCETLGSVRRAPSHCKANLRCNDACDLGLGSYAWPGGLGEALMNPPRCLQLLRRAR